MLFRAIRAVADGSGMVSTGRWQLVTDHGGLWPRPALNQVLGRKRHWTDPMPTGVGFEHRERRQNNRETGRVTGRLLLSL